jgi:hypothetical protein
MCIIIDTRPSEIPSPPPPVGHPRWSRQPCSLPRALGLCSAFTHSRYVLLHLLLILRHNIRLLATPRAHSRRRCSSSSRLHQSLTARSPITSPRPSPAHSLSEPSVGDTHRVGLFKGLAHYSACSSSGIAKLPSRASHASTAAPVACSAAASATPCSSAGASAQSRREAWNAALAISPLTPPSLLQAQLRASFKSAFILDAFLTRHLDLSPPSPPLPPHLAPLLKDIIVVPHAPLPAQKFKMVGLLPPPPRVLRSVSFSETQHP